jgi:predicted nucleic-acid-binding Zn-ribbon protein
MNHTISTCLKCGSDKIIPGGQVLDGAYKEQVLISIETEPNALIFHNKTVSPTFVNICGTCGFLEWYASNPEKLWNSFEKILSSNKNNNSD